MPGHPFPRDPTTRVHSNAGQHYLLKTALVENPPIPFKKNTIVRGRRTKPIEDLQEEMQRELEKQKAEREAKRQEFLAKAIKEMNESGQANQPEMNDETYQAYMRGEGPPPRGTALMQIVPTGKGRPTGPGARGGTSKGGTTVHTCPAENCTAAFKRSEHLRRHYKSVHRGEKREFGAGFSRRSLLADSPSSSVCQLSRVRSRDAARCFRARTTCSSMCVTQVVCFGTRTFR